MSITAKPLEKTPEQRQLITTCLSSMPRQNVTELLRSSSNQSIQRFTRVRWYNTFNPKLPEAMKGQNRAIIGELFNVFSESNIVELAEAWDGNKNVDLLCGFSLRKRSDEDSRALETLWLSFPQMGQYLLAVPMVSSIVGSSLANRLLLNQERSLGHVFIGYSESQKLKRLDEMHALAEDTPSFEDYYSGKIQIRQEDEETLKQMAGKPVLIVGDRADKVVKLGAIKEALRLRGFTRIEVVTLDGSVSGERHLNVI
jgi:hypothetical protein